jgi:hypothetical protein
MNNLNINPRSLRKAINTAEVLLIPKNKSVIKKLTIS